MEQRGQKLFFGRAFTLTLQRGFVETEQLRTDTRDHL